MRQAGMAAEGSINLFVRRSESEGSPFLIPCGVRMDSKMGARERERDYITLGPRSHINTHLWPVALRVECCPEWRS